MNPKYLPQKIDLSNDPRRAHFEYFSGFANPYVGLTASVDITRFMEWRNDHAYPFFLSLLYQAVQAANGVPELRRRISRGEVLEYPWCLSSHTVAKADGSYAYCVLDANMPFEEFLPTAAGRHEHCKTAGSIDEGDEALGYFFVSSMPWISYQALVQPVPTPADSNPRISWGKFERSNDRIVLPVSLLCHHALVDGLHIAHFYENLNERLAGL